MTTNDQNHDYRSKRALMLLRVSTPKQEEGFGWPAQEKEIRKKLIEPLGLRLDENKHIIRDTYTGLEFRQRPVLIDILEMAKMREFDILTVDVLDRLGRKGLERELYRMQLRELGVRILTTDPNEHSDDDSLTGELIRLISGHEAEQELNKIKRRTMNGKRVKIEGDANKGVLPKILGNSERYYGYKFVLDEKGKRVNITPNIDVILIDDDLKWTEEKVIRFIFESIAKGESAHKVAKSLNDKGIACPKVAKGITNKTMKYPTWHPSTITRWINEGSVYWGEARFNRVPMESEREPGRTSKRRRKTSEDEQIIVPVPAIVTRELAEQAQMRMALNQNHAVRNNRNPEQALLRGGLARCGYCKRTMRTVPHYKQTKHGEVPSLEYACQTKQVLPGVCPGCSIRVPILDKVVWEKAVEFINDPKEIDERVARERKKDPTSAQRKRLNAKLKEIREEQSALQDYLSEKIRKRTLDGKTEARLNQDLHQLAKEEEDCLILIAKVGNDYDRWQKIEKKLDELHKKCTEAHERMNDANYEISYKEKREILIFLGITAYVFRMDHQPRIDLRAEPPDIVSLLSLRSDRWSGKFLNHSV